MTPLDILRRILASDEASVAPLVDVLAADGPEATSAWLVLQNGGLLPLASASITRAGLIHRLGTRHQATLRSAVEASALRNALLRRLALDVTRRLASAGIPVLWAKGVWLAHSIYEQPALRTMSDVDLFVPDGRRSEAVAVLERAGFSRDPLVEHAGLEVFADALRPPAATTTSADDLSVDVHDSLVVSTRHTWSMTGVWARAQPARIGRAEVMLPTAEDGLRMAAIHAMKHGLDPRHLFTAVADARAILGRGAVSFDVGVACRSIDDPFEATALYALLSAAGVHAIPPAGCEVLLRAEAVCRRHGLRARADQLVAAADHGAFMRQRDFSLFAVGEKGLTLEAGARLVRGALRWRRRLRQRGGNAAADRGGVTQVLRANWRVARTTYLAGRLARLAEQAKVDAAG